MDKIMIPTTIGIIVNDMDITPKMVINKPAIIAPKPIILILERLSPPSELSFILTTYGTGSYGFEIL